MSSLDDPPSLTGPIIERTPSSLIGSVFERKPTPSNSRFSQFQKFGADSGKTGFPTVKHRSEPHGQGIVKGKSAFLRNREERGAAASRTRDVPAVMSYRSPPAAGNGRIQSRNTPDDKEDDWREQISRDNEKAVAEMTDEERERERQEIIERFGDGIADLLRKAKEARLKKPTKEDQVIDDIDEVPVTSETPLGSPPRSPTPLSSFSASPSRSMSPTRMSRKLRFAELTSNDVHVYESAPSSPKRKALLALPPPPTDPTDKDDIVYLGTAKLKTPIHEPSDSDGPPSKPREEEVVMQVPEPDEGTPEYIRRRYFPSEPTNNADLAWMADQSSSSQPSSSTEPSLPQDIRFDLSGNPIPPSASLNLPTHLGLHHHADGAHAGYSLDDIFHLVRSKVGAQRMGMLAILKGIVGVLKQQRQRGPHKQSTELGDDRGTGADPEEMQSLLAGLQAKTPILLKQILFAGLEALGERGSVGVRAAEVVWECTVGWERVEDEDESNQIDIDNIEWKFGGIEMGGVAPTSTGPSNTSDGTPSVNKSSVDSLVPVLPLAILLPQIAKMLTAPPDFDSSSVTQTPTQQTLLSLLHHIARHSNGLAEQIAQTSGLVAAVVDVFLFPPNPPSLTGASATIGMVDTSALVFLTTLVAASRANAKALIDTGIATALLKFIVVSIGELESASSNESSSQEVTTSSHRNQSPPASEILEKTLRIYILLGRYGMFANVASSVTEVWRRVGAYVGREISSPGTKERSLKIKLISTWAGLLETWIVCATDPHRTTPDHDILWSQVSAWGWGDDLIELVVGLRRDWVGGADLETLASAIWTALAAWLEGCRVNGVRGGEKERNECLTVLRPGFEGGVEGRIFSDALDGLSAALEQPDSFLKLTNLQRTASQTVTFTAAIRLWLACLPPSSEGPLLSPPFVLPFPRISTVSAHLVGSSVWSELALPSSHTQRRKHANALILSRPLSSLLFSYLRLSKRLPGISQDLWMTQAFSILLRLQSGDEVYALELLQNLSSMLGPEWARERGLNMPDVFWSKGGVDVIKPFIVDLVLGSEKLSQPDDEDEPEETRVVGPLSVSPKSILEATTLRVPVVRPAKNARGLPLRRDWMLSPLDHLLKSGNSHLIPSSWDASETDVVRAALLLAKIGTGLLTKYKPDQRGNGTDGTVSMTREEVVFGCMKVFMLEHGLEDGQNAEGEVFRDSVVSSLLDDLTRPYTLGAATASIGQGDLESAATSFLGTSTPFYQFYTDFVALYDAISFSHPTFARLLLPPTSMRYPIDYRKHLWDDYGHSLKNIRTPIDQIISGDLAEYLWPIEDDRQMIGAYLRALVRYGPSLQGFVRFVAIHHVASNIWDDSQEFTSETNERAGTLLKAIAAQGSPDVVREVVRYQQARGKVVQPPECFEGTSWKIGRLKRVDDWGLRERLVGIFEESN